MAKTETSGSRADARETYRSAGLRHPLGQNPPLEWLINKGPWAAALLVLLFGPLVMWITHFVYMRLGWLDGVDRPLTYFLSATFGDALVLPLIVYLCISALRDMADDGSARIGGWLAWAPITWALLSTAALNVLWLSDSANVNWTQPVGRSWFGGELHLNAAGWLHAAFFVAMQWLVAEFTVRLATTFMQARAYGVANEARGRSLGSIALKTNVILALSLVFSGLLIRDYWPQVAGAEKAAIWTWFLIPMLAVIACVAMNGLLLEIIGRDVKQHQGANVKTVRTGVRGIVALWSLLLATGSLSVIVWGLADAVASVGPLVVSCLALAILASVNVWAEVYFIQCRTPEGWVPVVALVAVFATALAGFIASLTLLVSHGTITALAELVGPWSYSVIVAFGGCAAAIGIGLVLEGYESLSSQSLASHRCGKPTTYLGAESPTHDIVQNLMQYGALQALLPLYAAAYVVLAQPLMLGRLDPGTQVSLLFGYAGVVVAAVTFPLYNNMQYVRDLESRKDVNTLQIEDLECRQLRGEEQPRLEYYKDLARHLDADRHFTMALSIAVGVIAVLSAMWMWISVLDLTLAAA